MLRFAIVGAADAERNRPDHPYRFDPPVDIEETRKAAVALGGEIARKGCGLIVYDARFVEADVVSGYVAASPEPDGTERPIVIRQPQDGQLVRFQEEASHPKLFERQADKTGLWEVSFYRSLADSAGVVLLGGANSTLVAGQVVIGARIPVLALERTGGAASTVWKTVAPDIDLPKIDEHARMAKPLSTETPAEWLAALLSQHRRRYAVETGPIVWHAVWAAILFAIALAAALASNLVVDMPTRMRTGLLFVSTPLAGAAGAAIRMVFERRYGSGPIVPPSFAITAALGMMAGALAGLLYFFAQAGDLDLAPASALRLAAIVAVVSTVGGLTAESIFRKLLGIDVLQTRGLEAGAAGARPNGTAS